MCHFSMNRHMLLLFINGAYISKLQPMTSTHLSLKVLPVFLDPIPPNVGLKKKGKIHIQLKAKQLRLIFEMKYWFTPTSDNGMYSNITKKYGERFHTLCIVRVSTPHSPKTFNHQICKSYLHNTFSHFLPSSHCASVNKLTRIVSITFETKRTKKAIGKK